MYIYASPTPEVVVVAFIINTGTVKQCYMLPLVCGTCTCTVHENFSLNTNVHQHYISNS